MKIVHISTSDNNGGAARAAYRLHHGLVLAGIDSTLLVATKTLKDSTIKAVPRDESIPGLVRLQIERWKTARRITPHASSIANGYELFSTDTAANPHQLPRSLPACDLIHLHWVTWFMDWRAFFSNLPPQVPLVWTLHDMNAFTGGCHYDAGCAGYLRGCGKCPALDSTADHDLSSRVFRRKAEALRGLADDRLHLVLPSRWLGETVKSSPLLGRFPQSVIPHGLDTSKFRPINRSSCRAVLGIPDNARVVLFIADSIENTRKGFAYLLQSLALLADIPGIFLLSIGKPSDQEIAGIPHLSLGAVANDYLLPAVYSAADVTVIPSLQEVFGMTVFESLACGTPAVGFNTGGIPDMIRPGITGYLATPTNATELSLSVRQVLCGSDAARMSVRCREIAVAEYDQQVQANQCIELYRSLLSPRARSGTPSPTAEII